MEKIENLNLARLRNNEHFEFMSGVDELALKHTEVELPFGDFYPKFKIVLNEEQITMQAERGSMKSNELMELDNLRDKTVRAIWGRVKATVLCPVKEEADSAEVIKRIFEKYGTVHKLSYLEESSALKNLLSVLLRPVNEKHITNTGVTVWVKELQKQNNGFSDRMNERNEEYARRIDGDVQLVRQTVDPLYLQMMERLNASLVLEMATPAAMQFAKELNEKIKYLKMVLAVRMGKTDQEKPETK